MKIAIIGYGKMGKTIEKIAIKEKIEIVCIIDKKVQEGDSVSYTHLTLPTKA